MENPYIQPISTQKVSQDDVVNLYLQGLTIFEVAEKTGISAPYVSKILKKHGVSARKKSGRDRNADVSNSELCAAYAELKSSVAVAEKFGVCSTTVLKAVRAEGNGTSIQVRKKRNYLDDSQKKSVVQMYSEGLSMRQVSEHFGVSESCVVRIVGAAGVVARERSGRPRGSAVDDFSLVRAYVAGKTSVEVAEEFGVAGSTVIDAVRSAGEVVRPGGAQKLDIPSSVVEQYKQGVSVPEIAKSLGVSSGPVERVLKEEGIQMRGSAGNSDGNCIADFFDVIDTSAKAWILGWMISDGCVQEGNRVSITLGVWDIDVLQKVKNHIRATTDIMILQRAGARLQLKNASLFKSLVALGVVEKKSFVAKVPDVRSDLKRHVLRGIFEGDGWISKDVKSINVCGSRDVCHWVKRTLEEADVVVGDVTSSENIFRIGVHGEQNVRKAVEYMYSGVDKSEYMERKYARAHHSKYEVVQSFDGLELAEQFLRDNHYLKTLPVACHTVGWWVDKELKGIAVFGSPSGGLVAKSLFGGGDCSGVWELRRFCIKDAEKNDSSRFLAKSIGCFRTKLIGRGNVVRAIVSYADEGVGHYGTIYRATNAVYLGSTPYSFVVDSEGKRLDMRNSEFEGKLTVKQCLRHKYVYFFDGAEKDSVAVKKDFVD
jgi:transposase